MGRTSSWACQRAVSRWVRSWAISFVVAAEREAIAVRAWRWQRIRPGGSFRHKFTGFLGQLALTTSRKIPNSPTHDTLVLAPTARGYPRTSSLCRIRDRSRIAQNVAGCRERGPYSVEILGGCGRTVFEGDQPVALGDPTGHARARQGNLIGIDVPRPQGDPGRVRGVRRWCAFHARSCFAVTMRGPYR